MKDILYCCMYTFFKNNRTNNDVTLFCVISKNKNILHEEIEYCQKMNFSIQPIYVYKFKSPINAIKLKKITIKGLNLLGFTDMNNPSIKSTISYIIRNLDTVDKNVNFYSTIAKRKNNEIFIP